MRGPDGKIVNKLNWDQYTLWQRWDEYPERKNNPPLTVETTFWYDEEKYTVTSINEKYVIVKQPSFEEVISSDNFLELVNKPFFKGKTFKELIDDFWFEI